jgi:Cu2+-exporting ATPase
MTCCAPGADAVLENAPPRLESDDAALLALSRKLGDGTRQLEYAVPDAHCAACIRTIETSLAALPQVASARVNLTRRRVRVVFDPARGAPSELAPAIAAGGYHSYVLDPTADSGSDPVLAELITALAVAGFAAGNIMLFSVSVWSGANDATRDLFHWLSAIIALPAVAWSGRLFFRSAWRALRVGRTNMDVPISIGVILATLLSLYETVRGGGDAYFDASVTLLFFLLIGRTLDHLMRERARSAIGNLARLQPRGATRLLDDGSREYVRLDEIAPGMRLELRAGDRVPVDGLLEQPGSFDYSAISGETRPVDLGAGGEVPAGAVNTGGLVRLRAARISADSFLARMAALMEAAESARTRPRRIADRAAAIYAPVVHALTLLTLFGWGLASGDWHAALVNAVAVLIITCPCALALAVPIVHVVAAGRLFERGVLMKDGAALERLAEVDSVAFDKTGTLTQGEPRIVSFESRGPAETAIAAALAAASSHPLARAVAAHLGDAPPLAAAIAETPGQGLETVAGGSTWRFGSPSWCAVPETGGAPATEVCLARDGEVVARFRFADQLRPDAAAAVASLGALRLPVRLLSGDSEAAVAAAANAAGIRNWTASLLPAGKVRDVATGRTLMVGDGINDAPALRAAHVSMAPSSATDIGRSAADFVFTGGRLAVVPFSIATARRAARVVTQNLVLAIGYNAVAVPLAIGGHVTPLIAAIAMSSSSLLVVANALRLRLDIGSREPRPAVPALRERAT